jgi:hypothetical protein
MDLLPIVEPVFLCPSMSVSLGHVAKLRQKQTSATLRILDIRMVRFTERIW